MCVKQINVLSKDQQSHLITTIRGNAAKWCGAQVHVSHSQLRLCVSSLRIADGRGIQKTAHVTPYLADVRNSRPVAYRVVIKKLLNTP